MISERTLRKWRAWALEIKDSTGDAVIKELCGYVLKMTQELMDLHLLRKQK